MKRPYIEDALAIIQTLRENGDPLSVSIHDSGISISITEIVGTWKNYPDEPGGRWWTCSACGTGQDLRTEYCPNCGAIMDNPDGKGEAST